MPWLPMDMVFVRYLEIKLASKISIWPRDKTPRVDGHFRLLHGEGAPYPMASRFQFAIATTVPFPSIARCWVDVLWDEGAGHFFGTSGLSNANREVTLTVTEYDGIVDPIFGVRGRMFDWTYQVDGGGVSHFYHIFDIDASGDYTVPLQIKFFPPSPTPMTNSCVWVEPNDLFNSPATNCVEWFATNVCYAVETEIPDPSPLFADFDEALEKRIEMDGTPVTSARWRFEFDINRHSPTGEVTVASHNGVAQTWMGFTAQNIRWWGDLTPMDDPLPIDDWIHIDYDYQWLAVNNTARVFHDGILKGTSVQTHNVVTWNTFGKSMNAYKGVFDIRNFLVLDGGVASPTVTADYPFSVNACDVGPDLHGGTTFNMDLPSCP